MRTNRNKGVHTFGSSGGCSSQVSLYITITFVFPSAAYYCDEAGGPDASIGAEGPLVRVEISLQDGNVQSGERGVSLHVYLLDLVWNW
jgi:hypothetical protein